MVLISFLFACNTSSWDSPEDCEALSAGERRDDCWSVHAVELFKTNPDRGESLVEEQVSDQQIRDFIWLQVTREVNPGSYRYCEKIQESVLQERCKTLVSRPHLHRELLQGEQSPGGQGGAPGGGPPGGGPPQGGSPGGGPPGGGSPPGGQGGPPPGQQ
ncbi:MAG: hypothetical protein P8R54_20050 [Myxococcota bacterium]|nr:hypothetical protein [Myxococcota bacterium]